MKLILFEVYYRIFYTINAIIIIECFSYFVQGHLLEFFFGLFTFTNQAVNFDSYGDLKNYELQVLPEGFQQKQEQKDCFLFYENKEMQISNCKNKTSFFKQQLSCFENNYLENKVSNFFAISPNEGKAWFYLSIVYLTYFYCLEIDKATLKNILIYVKHIYFCILIIIQIYSLYIPSQLSKSAKNHLFILSGFIIILLLSKSSIIILTAIFEELQLEQLDSELL